MAFEITSAGVRVLTSQQTPGCPAHLDGAVQYCQPLQPVAGNLFLSVLIGAVPLAALYLMIYLVRRRLWVGALVSLVVALIVATLVWSMPLALALSAAGLGLIFGAVTVVWTLWNAVWLYHVAGRAGKGKTLYDWLQCHIHPDKRIAVLIVGFGLGGLLQGLIGLGGSIVIAGSLLVALGLPVLEALAATLVLTVGAAAFGSLGEPIIALENATNLNATLLSSLVGREVFVITLLLPFAAIVLVSGWKGLRTAWPFALVAGAAFAVTQFFIASQMSPHLAAIVAALVSLVVTVALATIWHPSDSSDYAIKPIDPSPPAADAAEAEPGSLTRPAERGRGWWTATFFAWLPWAIATAVILIGWKFNIAQVGRLATAWPGLDNTIFVTLYDIRMPAPFIVEPLGIGTALFVATGLSALALRLSWRDYLGALLDTGKQLGFALVAILVIASLTSVLVYSGVAYTIGFAVATFGLSLSYSLPIYPVFAALTGWLGALFGGSAASSNALFGNLQLAAARRLRMSGALLSATNAAGATPAVAALPVAFAASDAIAGASGKQGRILIRVLTLSLVLLGVTAIVGWLAQYGPSWLPHL